MYFMIMITNLPLIMKSNEVWATDNYEPIDKELYAENKEITIEAITGDHGDIIQPRVKKTKAEQQSRA